MKNMHWSSESAHHTLKAAFAAAVLLAVAAPAIALADGSAGDVAPSASGVYVTILSPNPGTSLTGVKQIEISAYYESSFGVASLDLVIDGKKLATQKLTTPENRGEISFLVDAAALRSGNHTIVVRATATDAEVSSARSTISLPEASNDNSFKQDQSQSSDSMNLSGSSDAAGVPSIDVLSPTKDSTVAGIVRIKVNAIDPSGKSPYVSLFVDHAFKTLRNFPPYTFDWDTTRLTNGPHTIEVWGYNDAQGVGHADPVNVMVNNPSGRTFERHDLLDDAPTVAKAKHFQPILTHKIAAQPVKATIAVTPRNKTVFATMVIAPKVFQPAVEPMIATANSPMIADEVSKSDRLVSISTDSAPLGAASVDETLIAPVIGERPKVVTTLLAPAVLPKPVLSTPRVAIATRVSNVVAARPVTVSSKITEGSAKVPDASYQTLSDNDLGDLDSDNISAEPVVPNAALRTVPVTKITPVKAIKAVAAMPIKAPVTLKSVGQPIFAKTASSTTTTSPRANTKLIRMASANVDENISTGENELTAPNLAPITSAVKSTVRQLTQHTITLSSLTRKDRSDLDGAYQVVVDDQRVNLDRPLQSKGAIMFAPFRQIFESQGGVLHWDNITQQVHAVSATREIMLTIGIKSALVNNSPVTLSAAPYLDMNRTMLPLDFFHVALGAHVSYDAISGHLLIETR